MTPATQPRQRVKRVARNDAVAATQRVVIEGRRALPLRRRGSDCRVQHLGHRAAPLRAWPGVDEPLLWYEGSGTSDKRYLLSDERGSVIGITNGSGNVTTVNTYDAYGVRGAANGGRFQYTGQVWLSEVGL